MLIIKTGFGLKPHNSVSKSKYFPAAPNSNSGFDTFAKVW
jgi:hypothetical protein